MGELTTVQAAKAVGIDQATLHRWMAARLVRAPRIEVRNGRAVRLWSEADIERLLATKAKIYRKGRGRKMRKP